MAAITTNDYVTHADVITYPWPDQPFCLHFFFFFCFSCEKLSSKIHIRSSLGPKIVDDRQRVLVIPRSAICYCLPPQCTEYTLVTDPGNSSVRVGPIQMEAHLIRGNAHKES